jgi:hypothetical protein
MFFGLAVIVRFLTGAETRPIAFTRNMYARNAMKKSPAHLDPMIAEPEGGPSSDMQRFED